MVDFNLNYALSKVAVSAAPLRRSLNHGRRVLTIDGQIREITLVHNQFTNEYDILDADARELLDRGLVGIAQAKRREVMAKISDFGKGLIYQYVGFPVYKKN